MKKNMFGGRNHIIFIYIHLYSPERQQQQVKKAHCAIGRYNA